MWLPDLADPARMTQILTAYAGPLGLPDGAARVEVLDARLTHPHRPESPRCRGWATCLVTPGGGVPVQLYVKGYPDAEASAAAWRADRATRPDGRRAHLPELGLVAWRFPEDPRLAALPALLDPRRAASILPPAARAVLGVPAGGDGVRTTVVRYQPEASATLRLDGDGDGSVFAKLLADGAADAATRHRALWAAAGDASALRVAEPLGIDADRQVLWTRGVPGLPLAAAQDPARLPEATRSLGALLAALHGAEVATTPLLTVDDLLVEAGKKAAKLVRAHPPVEPLVSGLLGTATRRRSDVSRERVRALHGDFHLDQLVSSVGGPVLVDLDSMVRGAPEIDLAEFLVDLALRALPAAVAGEVAHGLLTSYAAATGAEVDAALLSICVDAEFLNRCYRHLRRQAPGWRADLEAELDRHADAVALLGA